MSKGIIEQLLEALESGKFEGPEAGVWEVLVQKSRSSALRVEVSGLTYTGACRELDRWRIKVLDNEVWDATIRRVRETS